MSNARSWRRLGLEGFVIVSSILLAFGIDAWWEGRQEHARVETALRNLEVGFSEHLDLIDAELRRMEPFEERVGIFLGAESGETRVQDGGGYGRILESIHRPIVRPLNSDELMALLEAEALHDLDAAGLWAASAGWRGRWRIILDRHDSLYELEDEALRALSRVDAARSVVSNADALDEVDERALRAARNDEGVLSLAAVKALHLRVLRILYGDLQREADVVLAQVRAELAR